jgi:hypothetical protein
MQLLGKAINCLQIFISNASIRQRAGGVPDGSDLKKGGANPFGALFGKKKAEPVAEPEKKPNWWNLS